MNIRRPQALIFTMIILRFGLIFYKDFPLPYQYHTEKKYHCLYSFSKATPFLRPCDPLGVLTSRLGNPGLEHLKFATAMSNLTSRSVKSQNALKMTCIDTQYTPPTHTNEVILSMFAHFFHLLKFLVQCT